MENGANATCRCFTPVQDYGSPALAELNSP
jgi:hypothetical protein